MQTGLLWAASASAFVTFAVHTFIGGAVVARPLLAERTLPKATRWLAYYCWHIVTILLLALSLSFAVAATGHVTAGAVLGLSAFCAACSVLSIAVALKGNIAPWRFPSTSLFAITATLGLASHWAATG